MSAAPADRALTTPARGASLPGQVMSGRAIGTASDGRPLTAESANGRAVGSFCAVGGLRESESGGQRMRNHCSSRAPGSRGESGRADGRLAAPCHSLSRSWAGARRRPPQVAVVPGGAGAVQVICDEGHRWWVVRWSIAGLLADGPFETRTDAVDRARNQSGL